MPPYKSDSGALVIERCILALLKKRSELMLGLAAELLDKGVYDVAALLAEYAAQLRIKSLLPRHGRGVERPRYPQLVGCFGT